MTLAEALRVSNYKTPIRASNRNAWFVPSVDNHYNSTEILCDTWEVQKVPEVIMLNFNPLMDYHRFPKNMIGRKWSIIATEVLE